MKTVESFCTEMSHCYDVKNPLFHYTFITSRIKGEILRLENTDFIVAENHNGWNVFSLENGFSMCAEHCDTKEKAISDAYSQLQIYGYEKVIEMNKRMTNFYNRILNKGNLLCVLE